jgi:hypothetical protein
LATWGRDKTPAAPRASELRSTERRVRIAMSFLPMSKCPPRALAVGFRPLKKMRAPTPPVNRPDAL